MSAKLTLEEVKVNKTDDGIGSSEWKLDVNVLASGDFFETFNFDRNGVDSGDSFPVNKQFNILGAREGTYDPYLLIYTNGFEDDPVNDDSLPTKSLGPLHYHDQEFSMTAENNSLSYTLKWDLEVL